MKIILSLLLSLLLVSSAAFAADDDRWLLAGKDSPNNNAWYIDSRTLKIHENSTVLFWAKVMLGDPKYDITEIKIKYLLSADRLQLTKLVEIGYSKTGETIWNNNVSKTISVIPGSGPEKLVLFVDDFIQKQEAEKAKVKTAEKQAETPAASKDVKQQPAAEPTAAPKTEPQPISGQPTVKAAAAAIQQADKPAVTNKKAETDSKHTVPAATT